LACRAYSGAHLRRYPWPLRGGHSKRELG